MERFYVLAMFLAAAAVLVLGLTGVFSATTMIVFGFIGLGLIYAPALWSVLAEERETTFQ